jgi:hypothetical protein
VTDPSAIGTDDHAAVAAALAAAIAPDWLDEPSTASDD